MGRVPLDELSYSLSRIEAVMPHPPFRFVHASDFHLEQPLSGVSDVPEHLRELFIDAPYLAAEKVFAATILEGAAFLVLAGDILQPMLSGPRGLLFLCEQFEKLAARGIGVHWAGGDVDPPDDWPSALKLPGNVHVFPRGRVDEYLVQIDGVPAVRILGASQERQQPIRTGEFRSDSTGLFTVAVACGDADATMHNRGIPYWALGGRHERNSASRDVLVPGQPASRDIPGLGAQPVVHYCGTAQGRRPAESGVHGCTVVQVDEQNQVRTSLVPCDAARWLAERVVVVASTTRQDLASRLASACDCFAKPPPI